LSGRELPIDLARGAAAAEVEGPDVRPSPPMRLFLDAGAVLVAYGGEQSGAAVNERLGAGYPYGEARTRSGGREVEVHPGESELAALAQGAHGYGGASRSVYWPAVLALPAELRPHAVALDGGHHALLD